jgi:spore germination protein
VEASFRGGSAWRPAAFAVALLLTLLAAGAARASATVPVLGYQSEESPTSLIARDAAGLGTVGVDGLNLTGRPGAVSDPTSEQREQLSAAHAAGLPAVLLVGNYSSRINDFSEPLAWRTLSSPGSITALANSLTDDVRAEGWDGISVDFESLHPRDRDGLTELLRDLRADLGPEVSLTINIQNSTSAAEYAAYGYDLPALAESVDQIVLMAYDQHGPWEKTPGPVGAEGWVRTGLRLLLAQVPPSKVDLGVAGYGYAWEPGRRRQLSDASARALAARSGTHAHWDAGAGEWTAKLPRGGAVWWSDARTLARREHLASSLGLHGVAVWSLGLSDPIR